MRVPILSRFIRPDRRKHLVAYALQLLSEQNPEMLPAAEPTPIVFTPTAS